MLWGALKYGSSRNLGDDIQTIAASRFLPRIDVLIDRERLQSDAPAKRAAVVFNGWFLHSFGQWPPAESMRPLLFGFHIARPHRLLGPADIAYLRRFGPVGCRDLATVAACRAKGLNAYWSGCLTLTLPRQSHSSSDRIYLVDVDTGWERRFLPDSIRRKTIHRTHRVPRHRKKQVVWRRAQAMQRLAEYETARLVITSRLHAALPCMAYRTPVLLVHAKVQSDPRLSGWRDVVPNWDTDYRPDCVDWDRIITEPVGPSLPSEIGNIERRIRERIADVNS